MVSKFHLVEGGWGAGWDFRFCGFGQFMVRFFGCFPVFGALCGLRVFQILVFSSRFLSMMAVFRILLPNAFYGFPGIAKEVAPRSRGKTIIPRDHLQLEDCMTNLVSLVCFSLGEANR